MDKKLSESETTYEFSFSMVYYIFLSLPIVEKSVFLKNDTP